jgi:crotonobetainyl-CoA:carnitine CoA-transferase CaiB-like acyl-CoA transferase
VSDPDATPPPLAKVRVLDLTRALSGPFCSMILGDLGADVVKVEPLPDGEMIRSWGPFHDGIGVFFLSVNRNKRSLAVDFRSEQGRALVAELAAGADVLVENFKPGSTSAMGLDYPTLKARNPRLIYASITGFGSTGPYGTWPGFDQIAQGMSGLMSISGFPDGEPTRVGLPIGDMLAGMWAAIGVNAALASRHVTGEGQKVDTSLLAGLVGMLCVQGQRYLSLEEVACRAGNDHPVIYPYGAFTASDAPINLAAPTQPMWMTLCRILDLEELATDPDFHDNSARSRNRDALRERMNERLRTRPALEWSRELIAAGIPAGPIYSLDQVFADPQVQHCNMVETVQHPSIGPLRQLSSPLRMPGLESGAVRTHPPLLGEHSAQVLADYGVDPARIQELVATGVVGQSTGAAAT